MRRLPIALLGVTAAALTAFPAVSQTLQITAPPDAIVVHPGDTISVTVNSSSSVFKSIGLIGEDPFGMSALQSALPARFSVAVPQGAYPRKSRITAVGVTNAGETVFGGSVQVDIERPDFPIKLRTELPSFMFRSPSDVPLPILLFAVFQDGSALDVRDSSRVSYFSVNPAVAQVDGDGDVRARKPGKTVVTTTYSDGNRRLQLAIPVTVATGPIASSTYSLSFGDEAVGRPNTEKIVLTNATLGPVKILQLKVGQEFSETDNCISSLPIQSHATCIVNVTFAPSKAGPQKGLLTIIDSFSSEHLAILLSGTGQ